MVREALERAGERSARSHAAVRIVAVTKGHPDAAIEAALDFGLSDMGENRVEEMEGKVARLGREGIRWHMIGRLQSRKVPRLPEICDLLHSMDRLSLAQRIAKQWEEREAEAAGVERGATMELPVLIQVNTSGEEAKGGFALSAALDEIPEVLELPGFRVVGLMTMAPFTEDETVIRGSFARLRRLHEELGGNPRYRGSELSMGMTNDYAIAVEEGSTLVRLGTALFGERSA